MRVDSLSIAATTAAIFTGCAEAAGPHPPKAKNFIYVVPDGYGIASQVMARDYQSVMNGAGSVERPNTAKIGVDNMVLGTVRTQASDNLVTDSSASGTAFACGVKTYNGAVSVDDDGMPVGSILEAAFLDGFKTGLVVTSRITHATPAVYSSHVLDRGSENEIAAQQIGKTHPFGPFVDLLIGGGRRHYLPKAEGGTREDDVNLIEWAIEQGYTYAEDASDLKEAAEKGTVPLPFLGLFNLTHISYEMDRDPETEPSLLETTKIALDTLEAATKKTRKGYFIMIEASRIDHAGHANDAPAHIHETLMFNEVMNYIKEYIEDHPDTQMLSAADHECGGLTLIDGFDPTVLARAQYSNDYLMAMWDNYNGEDRTGFLRDELVPLYGLGNYTDADIQVFLNIYEEEGTAPMGLAILKAVAKEGGVNWSTGGHTAADVVLHGYAKGKKYEDMKRAIGGNQNNINLPGYIEKVLGLDMSKATKALRKDGVGWVEKRDQLSTIKRRAEAAAKDHAH
ncbi:hypothetical protein NLU13_1509 [Sarocladium strictum]|uniref:Alkaline phosphatase n=1 Tax=Sarocladium strictum TaxID=5046 RepID=A0AA39LBV5_SARSR|nr:hypothetical protein NLU13_1509 [Sarocladium strictum]